MWESGAYNRDGLNELADEVDAQKSELLNAWRRNDRLFDQLNGLNDVLMAAATADETTAQPIIELV